MDMEDYEITPVLLEKEQKAQFNYFQAFRREEEYWRPLSRSTWLKVGDHNTSFFHKRCRVKLSQNHISEISSLSGETFTRISQIKQVVEVHFQNLFKEDGYSDTDLTSDFLSNIPCMVSEEENDELMKLFSEQEIIDVIWSMEPDKASGPNGFSFQFYRVCWTIIRNYLLCMIKAFQLKSKVGSCTNSTFLALIPKEANPYSFVRFKPISLCNASYKMFSKLLANGLKHLLGKLISPLQGRFVKGRHILDNVIQV